MQLQKDDVVRVRLIHESPEDEWTMGKVLLVSPNGESVVIQLDGMVRAAGGFIGGFLPISINYETETVTSLLGDPYEIDVVPAPFDEDDRDVIVATFIKQGICPWNRIKAGETIAHCPLGFPGCACGDELMANPYLAESPKPAHTNIDVFRAYSLRNAKTIELRHKVDGHYKFVMLADLSPEEQEHWIRRWWADRAKKKK